MDRSSASNASPGPAASVASFSAARFASASGGPVSLFSRPITRSSDRSARFTRSTFSPEHGAVPFDGTHFNRMLRSTARVGPAAGGNPFTFAGSLSPPLPPPQEAYSPEFNRGRRSEASRSRARKRRSSTTNALEEDEYEPDHDEYADMPALLERGSSPDTAASPVRRVMHSRTARGRGRGVVTFDDTPSPPPRRSLRSRRPTSPPEVAVASRSSPRAASRKRKASPDSKKPPAKKRAPGRLKRDPDDEEQEDKNHVSVDSNCCICMTEPEPADVAKINGCEHMFCFECIEKWADRENTCPLCKARFVKIERVHKQKSAKGRRAPKSSKKVKNKSQRSEMTHSVALEGLFGELSRNGFAIESIFSRLGAGGPGGASFNAHIARIFVNGLGGGGVFEAHVGGPGPFAHSSPPTTRASAASAHASAAAARAAVPGEGPLDIMFSDSDDDDDGYNGFVASIRRMESLRAGGGGSIFGVVPSMYRPPRNFAINMNDVDAGESADNALEIQDDSDDEIEVVHVEDGR